MTTEAIGSNSFSAICNRLFTSYSSRDRYFARKVLEFRVAMYLVSIFLIFDSCNKSYCIACAYAVHVYSEIILNTLDPVKSPNLRRIK